MIFINIDAGNVIFSVTLILQTSMNLHFRMYREDYYIQKVKMALSNPVYHITEYTIYIPATCASHYVTCFSHLLLCWLLMQKKLYTPTTLKFDNTILRYVSDAPNTLIGGVNVFHVTVAVINHLQCSERRLIKCSPDIVTYFIKLHLLSCVPLSRQ